MSEVSDWERIVDRVGGENVQGKTETLEVLPDVFHVWVTLVQLATRGELLLEQVLDRRILILAERIIVHSV